MEGESPLLKEGALSLQTSLSHRELSHRTPLLQERKFVSLFVTAGFCGKVFLSDWEVRDFLQGAAIALFLWVGNIYETHSTNQSGAKPHRQKNTSRPNQKLPPRAPAKAKRNKLSQCKVGALGESVFVAWGDTDFLQDAAIALFLWGTHFVAMPCTSAGRRNLGTHVRHNL